MSQNREDILKKLQIYRTNFFAIIFSELAMMAAFVYIKIVHFPDVANWWLGIVIFPGLIALFIVLNKVFLCPNCQAKLVGPDGIKLFDDRCENCGTAFK